MARHLAAVWVGLGVAVLSAGPLTAQAEVLREQGLGRPYWHVFLAYAVVLVLILGWVVSIARRLRAVETRLRDPGD